jgi:hypothetical protein
MKLGAAFGCGAVVALLTSMLLASNGTKSSSEPSRLVPRNVVQRETVAEQAPLAVVDKPTSVAASKTLERTGVPKPRVFTMAVERPVVELAQVRIDDEAEPIADVQPVVAFDAPAASASLPPPQPGLQHVTLPAGHLLTVRMGESLRSDRNEVGDGFFATLDQPLVIDGWLVAERGARVLGHIADIDRRGRPATMTLQLDTLRTSDGQRVGIRTASFVRKADGPSKKEVATKVGIAVAIGVAIGGAAGGGKGAAIGAAAGGAAGAITASRGNTAELEVETRLTFRVDDAVVIQALAGTR